MTDNTTDYSKRIITIPNLMSFFRIILIPFFIYYYVKKQNDMAAFIVLALSGLSDCFDGKIARHFNMVSDLGKALDPIADKLTQIIVVFCLISRYEYLKPLLILQLIKELSVGLTSLLALQKDKVVLPADWHGKIVTALMYSLILLHLLPIDISFNFIQFLLMITFFMMVLSLILYLFRNITVIRSHDQQNV